MDINTLKEIDILAFGPRARIARAIKELNAKYYGVPILSPSASSYITDLPSTPESYSAPQSAQSTQTTFYPTNSVVTPSQSYQASPVTAQGPVAAGAGADHLRGLGLAEASPAQSSGTASSSVAGSAAGSTQHSSMRRSNTSRTREQTTGTDESFDTANDALETGVLTKTPKEVSTSSLAYLKVYSHVSICRVRSTKCLALYLPTREDVRRAQLAALSLALLIGTTDRRVSLPLLLIRTLVA